MMSIQYSLQVKGHSEPDEQKDQRLVPILIT